ncbi:MAG: serine/threonine protein kinase, partial [Holophagales bacterium]|nr:serine/threonine protein kinase [Holophagales bacterium]
MIGKTLGDYRIERELGRGGMGTVYAAEDQNLGRRVAIKLISASLGDDPSLVDRFRKEAKALARLQHPNVVLVHSFFRHEDRWLLVMEMVEGEQLDDHLKRSGALPWPRVADLGIALLDGLQHAHEQGVVHRDVKTSNCLLTPEGGIKIMDFGIALVEGEGRLTRRGHVVGTPHYIAPEQVSGRPADPRTDLYSLGVVLYEMVTGRVPFESDSEFELLRAHLETTPISPRARVSSVPDWLEAVILKALAK